MSDPRPIGVFDSGVGGLTVLREILRRSPHESTIYLGDNLRAPYGVRSDDEVRAFSIEALDALAERDVKAIVVACNTSTAVALGDFRRRYDLPILGVVRPGAVTAALATRNRRVGRDRDAGHGPLARLLQRDQGREPGRRGLRARDAGVRAARRGRPAQRRRGRGDRGRVARAAPRRARRGRRVRLPAAAVRPDRHAPPGLHPLPAPPAGDRRASPASGSRSSTRRRRRHRPSSSCSRSTGSRHRARPAGRPPTRAPPGTSGRTRRPWPSAIVQLTTGDVGLVPGRRRADLRRGVPGRRLGAMATSPSPGRATCRRRERHMTGRRRHDRSHP